jgi:putative salt-induced outer membrane protein
MPGTTRTTVTALVIPMLFAAVGGVTAQESSGDPTWSGEAEFSFVSTSGNSSTRTLGTAVKLEREARGWAFESGGSFVRSRAEGELNAESVTGLFRAARELTTRFEAYGKFDYLRNRFAGIDHRISPEAGAALQLLSGQPHSLRATGALGYVRETRQADETRSFASANTGLRYRWALSPTAELSSEGSYTANLQDAGDWRIGNRAALRVAVTSIFSIRVSHTLEHLNQPVPGFENTDSRVSVALVAGF